MKPTLCMCSKLSICHVPTNVLKRWIFGIHAILCRAIVKVKVERLSLVNGMVCRRSLEVVECGARRHLMKIYALGIDLGKTVFHLVGLDASGQVVVRKRCSRTQLLALPRICKCS